MFGELYEMWRFISLAPYFIVGAFLLTFTFTKVAQSESLYRVVTARIDLWRAKQSRKIRAEMLADVATFLRGRKEQDLLPVEQKIYYRMLESYYHKMERLYESGKEQQ